MSLVYHDFEEMNAVLSGVGGVGFLGQTVYRDYINTVFRGSKMFLHSGLSSPKPLSFPDKHVTSIFGKCFYVTSAAIQPSVYAAAALT